VFPKNEVFGLTSQIRRAAVSISSNNAESAAWNHKNEFRQFLFIALSSDYELDNQLIIANNLSFFSSESKEKLQT
jgi:four helix bundle protein